MKPKRTTAAEGQELTSVRVVLLTLDNHVSAALDSAFLRLKRLVPGLQLAVHAAADWEARPDRLAACRDDIAEGDIIIATMMFMEPHIAAVIDALEARRNDCDAMICCMSASEVMKLTRMGRFSMDGEQGGAMALLKRLRGKSTTGGKPRNVGAQQLSVLRRLPRILRFIPGTAQDLRVYFLTLQYWLAGSEENLARMIQLLVRRYASGPRASLRQLPEPGAPIDYPEVGIYHPGIDSGISAELDALPNPRAPASKTRGTVGLLLMRSYALAGNSRHYDAVIKSLEDRGLRVIPAFASGLDARPAVQRFFMEGDRPIVDAVVSLTGFSLVGGPAYNDTDAAQALLKSLDVPYLAVQALEFQSLETWSESSFGLMPIEATMMVSIPELDGATGPLVFGGRSDQVTDTPNAMRAHEERIDMLANRVSKLVHLRRQKKSARKVAVVLFNFPPNSGSTGTAAHLSVFESLYNTLKALAEDGYSVDLPDSVASLRDAILLGNAQQRGTDANVCASIDVDDHVRHEPWLAEIESQWGPAPGKQLTDGRSIHVLGAEFGNVLVTCSRRWAMKVTPCGCCSRAATHQPMPSPPSIAIFVRPGRQTRCFISAPTEPLSLCPANRWACRRSAGRTDSLAHCPLLSLRIKQLEGLIAKRRSAATLISYLTPPVASAELYQGLKSLGDSIDRWRQREEQQDGESLAELISLIKEQAAACELADQDWQAGPEQAIECLRHQLREIEETLIPYGLHVVGEVLPRPDRLSLLQSIATAQGHGQLSDGFLNALLDGAAPADLASAPEVSDLPAEDRAGLLEVLVNGAAALGQDSELPALLKALDGRFIPPVGGGDLLRSPDMLPTGRNLHGFDPFRLPSQFAIKEGQRQASQLLDRHRQDGQQSPTSVALVLWGTDNLKSEGIAIGQALALMGARPRLDGYGRVCGAELIDLEELGRPRIDVVMTLSGIFRDLLPLQTRLLAEAAYLAAMADEPVEQNAVRAHALAYQAEHDCDLETAALRVFSNAEGTYGSNVNMLIDSGAWQDEDELADTFTARKGHAYGRSGAVSQNTELLSEMLSRVDLAYQNLDSVELGVTTVDHYFDTLGGISRAIRRSGADAVPVYIADHTTGNEKIRTLAEQVALETRTRY